MNEGSLIFIGSLKITMVGSNTIGIGIPMIQPATGFAKLQNHV